MVLLRKLFNSLHLAAQLPETTCGTAVQSVCVDYIFHSGFLFALAKRVLIAIQGPSHLLGCVNSLDARIF